MTDKIPQRRDDLSKTGTVVKGPSGKDSGGAIEKGGDGPSPLSFDIA